MSNPYEHGGRGTKWAIEMYFAASHDIDCEWHCDQYPWECTCDARVKHAATPPLVEALQPE